MTTFVVSRTSQLGRDDEAPCPEAYRGRRERTAEWAREGEADVWLIDLPDLDALLAFVDRHFRVILGTWDPNEDQWEIEIYDDYRE